MNETDDDLPPPWDPDRDDEYDSPAGEALREEPDVDDLAREYAAMGLSVVGDDSNPPLEPPDEDYSQEATERRVLENERALAMVIDLPGYKTRKEREAEEAAKKRKKFWRTWGECVDEIYARQSEPWVDIRVGSTVIARCRNGSFVPLVAPSGAGKSTLALQMLVDHAIHHGPAIYVTYELDGDEAVGRAIGQHCEWSWSGVLQGQVPRERVPNVERIRILDGDDAKMENIDAAIAAVRAEYPDQPVFVVVDYMQATPAPPGKERGFMANLSRELRRAAKRNRVVLIGVSQASTDNSRKMRSGELLGLDAAATGAETSQIERDAYVILTLGDRQKVDHETLSWKLSTAKYRMGEPDQVFEMHFRGRIGTWEVVGDPRPAVEVRAEKQAEKKRLKSTGGVEPTELLFKRVMKEHAAGRRELCTKNFLREGSGCGKDRAVAALDVLVHDNKLRVVTIVRQEMKRGQLTDIERLIYEPVVPEQISRPESA